LNKINKPTIPIGSAIKNTGLTMVFIKIANKSIPIPLNSFFIINPPTLIGAMLIYNFIIADSRKMRNNKLHHQTIIIKKIYIKNVPMLTRFKLTYKNLLHSLRSRNPY
jgi:hypothetical protein